MTTRKKIVISFLSIIIMISFIFIIYYVCFYPKIITTPINNNIETKKIDILKKFSIDDFSLSLKNKSLSSTIKLNDSDLTDLIIIALKEVNDLEKYVSGINVDIKNQDINLYCTVKYKGIPFYVKFIFTISNDNHAIILNYKKGNLGFIPISKEFIFSKLKDTSMLKFDKNNGNIILTLENIKQLTISDVNINNNIIYITLNGSLKFN